MVIDIFTFQRESMTISLKQHVKAIAIKYDYKRRLYIVILDNGDVLRVS